MSFTPRTDSSGMQDNPYWYSRNPFYRAGYGLPNCTAYAWGRFWEISDPNGLYINRPTLSTGNAGDWWGYGQDGYQRGQTPKLGSVICFDEPGNPGHVAIVEEILPNGDVVTSNSARHGQYFYMRTYHASAGYEWSDYIFQGFIYNPYVTPEPPTPTPTDESNSKKWFKFMKRKKTIIF